MKCAKTLPLLLAVLLLWATTAGAQETPKPPEDPQMKLVTDMTDQVWAQWTKFHRAGGKASDPENPARKWAPIFWQYHETHPGTAASAKAARQALYLYLSADQEDEAFARVDTLGQDDPFWDGPEVLFYLAEHKKDFTYIINKAESLLKQLTDKKKRTAVAFVLGLAYWEKKELERAKAAFEIARQESPESDYARRATGNIFEITSLNIGQPAPAFTVKTTDGALLSLADFKGKLVLLNFWATW